MIKPSEWVCDYCGVALNEDFTGRHEHNDGERCDGKMSARFTRDDLVRAVVAGFKNGHMLGGAPRAETAKRIVAEMLGEVEG